MPCDWLATKFSSRGVWPSAETLSSVPNKHLWVSEPGHYDQHPLSRNSCLSSGSSQMCQGKVSQYLSKLHLYLPHEQRWANKCLTTRGLISLRKVLRSPPVISSSSMNLGIACRLTPTQRTMFWWLNLLQKQKYRKGKPWICWLCMSKYFGELT